MSVLGVIGAAAGFVIGGPQGALLGYSLGSGVDALVNAPDQEGPRLDDLEVQIASYGAPIPFGYGTVRQTGSVMWPKHLELVEHKHSESAKGGPEMNTYTYTGSFAILIRQGRIAGVRRMWKNKKLVYDVTPGSTTQKDPGLGTIRFYLGTDTQEPDPLMEAKDGPSPAYLGYAYVMFEDSDMTDTQGRVAQWEFEVVTEGSDEIPASTTFGEAYNSLSGAYEFTSDMDASGNLWLSTMAGHATVDAATGKYVVDPSTTPTPQIQQYDGATGEILWAYDVPGIPEYWGGADSPPQIIYPIRGESICANGYYFVARGTAGWPAAPNPSGFVHGVAVNMQTHVVEYLTDTCSHGQFNNAFYWPAVPVPLVDNNKVYMAAGGSGVSSNFGIGFMPASISQGGGAADIDPVPNRTGAEVLWNVPAGWAQARVKGAPCPLPPNNDFDGVQVNLPNWARKATMIADPNAVIVQGYLPGGNYLQWVGHAPAVTSFELSAPSYQNHVELPGSPIVMPPIAWDAKNETLWAFVGPAAGSYSLLYAITPFATSATFTGFQFPEIPGESEGHDVKGMTIDTATGHLRVLLGGGFGNPVYLVLLDPVTQTVIEQTTVGTKIAGQGRLMDYPDQQKLVFSDGVKIHNIPYGTALDAAPVQLGKIVADLCSRAGLTSADIDVSQLTDMVDGYIVPRQMSARAAIEPLQTAFFFDAVESDDKLKFVKRAASSPILIPMEDRAARDFGSDLPDSLSIVRAQDYELPVQVDVEYADIEADHLVGSQYERRITKDTKQRINIQSPVVMTAQKAKEVAAVTLYRAWLNQTYKFTTSRKWAHLEPTDLVTLPTNEASYTARITSKREQPGGVIEWEAAMESLEVYTQPVMGAAPTNYVPQTVYDPGLTTLQLLDIPILRDADDNAGFYAAMAGTADGWKGAQLFKSADGGSTYEAVLTQSNEAAIGSTQSALPDFDGGNIFDEGSSVTVFMSSGQPLTSATEDQVLNGANLAVIGVPGRWEVVQFKNAMLIAPNTYQVSGFLRGRRGTEWAIGTHQVGDQFILASINTWLRINAGDMGLPRLYKAPPYRVSLSNTAAVSFTDTAVALKPFAPADLQGVRDGSGNLALSWNRRTRLQADTLHLPRPLGEAVESYSIDIMSGETVLRTLTSSTPSVVYSAADQAIDGIAPGNPVTVSITQVSASVGKGYSLEGIV